MEAMLSDQDIQNHLLKLQKSLKGHDLLKKFEFDERYLLRFLLGANFQIPLALKRVSLHLAAASFTIYLAKNAVYNYPYYNVGYVPQNHYVPIKVEK